MLNGLNGDPEFLATHERELDELHGNLHEVYD